MNLIELQDTLIDYALDTGNKELFDKMTKNDLKTVMYLMKQRKLLGTIINYKEMEKIEA